MFRNSSKFSFTLMLLSLALVGLKGQGWERSYGNAEDDAFSDVVLTADGGFIAVGYLNDLNSADVNTHLIKTDADGQLEWSKMLGVGYRSEYGKSIRPTADGGFIIGGTAMLDDHVHGFLLKTDGLGNEEWFVLSSRDSVQGRRVIQLSSGDFVLIGEEARISPSGISHGEMMLMKVDASGTEQWIQNYGGDGSESGYGLVETSDGVLLAGTTTSFGAGHYDVFIVKTDFSGNQLWQATHGTANAELGFSLIATQDGNFAIAGQSEALTPESENVFLLKIDPNGAQIWHTEYDWPGLEVPTDLAQTPDGGFAITGNLRAAPNADRNAFLLKTNNVGDEQWVREFGGINGDGGNAVKPAANDGFVVTGYTRSFGSGGADGYLLYADMSGVSISSVIYGNVNYSLNNLCGALSIGQPIEGYIVEVADPDGITYFGTTDADGNYAVPVEVGEYNVRPINPSPYWVICQDSLDVSITGEFEEAEANFTLTADIACPHMQVDLTTLGLRRCFPGSYRVKYRNFGSIVANPALVEVTFDEYLDIESASIPWVSQSGNTYVFNLGNVWPFEGGEFEVFFTVDCDSTVLGQTHCTEAVILPDSICLEPPAIWDGSSVEVAAVCQSDSVEFKIKNVGGGDMADILSFIIIEDHIMQMQGGFQLEPQQDTTIKIPSTGGTFRMEAEQSPGHPGNSRPSVTVEGCGGEPFSTGFVIQYPLNDADLSVDTDCRENIGSFDPNDKQGFPLGYGEEHFIDADTELEYLIRFQNTGTDTAFTVTIRDTLSPFLDPTSIQPGASSHAYRYDLYGEGILKFTFDDIMLPDSNVNEAASHGFVKFRIRQRAGNPIGSAIENSAGIYFDFNEPVITNTTTHRVGESFIVIDLGPSATRGAAGPAAAVHVSPNPFDGSAVFKLENIQGDEFRFNLFDASGGLRREAVFRTKEFQFVRKNLPAGLYFFQVENEEGGIASGKIILR